MCKTLWKTPVQNVFKTPTRKLMRQIFGAIAEYEKAMIVAKLRGARQRAKAREGRCEGRKPYGYHESEVAILEPMRQMRADGATYAAIADTLNREGVAPRDSDAQWHPGYVHRILSR
jgi:DNA invertase Pin-like site-specific DNA recombinase